MLHQSCPIVVVKLPISLHVSVTHDKGVERGLLLHYKCLAKTFIFGSLRMSGGGLELDMFSLVKYQGK